LLCRLETTIRDLKRTITTLTLVVANLQGVSVERLRELQDMAGNGHDYR